MNLSSCSNLTSTYNFIVLIPYMYHDLHRANLLIRFGYLLITLLLLPFIGKTLILLYTIIIYLQEKIILYAKMHNKNTACILNYRIQAVLSFN